MAINQAFDRIIQVYRNNGHIHAYDQQSNNMTIVKILRRPAHRPTFKRGWLARFWIHHGLLKKVCKSFVFIGIGGLLYLAVLHFANIISIAQLLIYLGVIVGGVVIEALFGVYRHDIPMDSVIELPLHGDHVIIQAAKTSGDTMPYAYHVNSHTIIDIPVVASLSYPSKASYRCGHSEDKYDLEYEGWFQDEDDELSSIHPVTIYQSGSHRHRSQDLVNTTIITPRGHAIRVIFSRTAYLTDDDASKLGVMIDEILDDQSYDDGHHPVIRTKHILDNDQVDVQITDHGLPYLYTLEPSELIVPKTADDQSDEELTMDNMTAMQQECEHLIASVTSHANDLGLDIEDLVDPIRQVLQADGYTNFDIASRQSSYSQAVQALRRLQDRLDSLDGDRQAIATAVDHMDAYGDHLRELSEISER
jgi:hypothetical protein